MDPYQNLIRFKFFSSLECPIGMISDLSLSFDLNDGEPSFKNSNGTSKVIFLYDYEPILNVQTATV